MAPAWEWAAQIWSGSLWAVMAALWVEVAVKGLFVLGFSAIVLYLLRRHTSASYRHLARALTLGAILALPLLSALLPGWELGLLDKTAFQSSSQAPFRLTARSPDPKVVASEAEPAPKSLRSDQPSLPAPGRLSNQAGTGEPLAGFAGAPTVAAPASTAWRISLAPILLTLWFIGALFFLVRIGVGIWCVRRAVRSSRPVEDEWWIETAARLSLDLGIDKPVRLLSSSSLEVALSVGFWNPVVILPEVARTWSRGRRRSILLHELCHVSRGDNAVNLMAQLACALHWHNPLVWITARELIVDRERACDDRVLANGTRPSEYAGHLLEVARAVAGRRLWGALEVSQSSALKDRLKAVLDPRLTRRIPGADGILAAAMLWSICLLPLAAVQPWKTPAPDAGNLGQALNSGFQARLEPLRRSDNGDSPQSGQAPRGGGSGRALRAAPPVRGPVTQANVFADDVGDFQFPRGAGSREATRIIATESAGRSSPWRPPPVFDGWSSALRPFPRPSRTTPPASRALLRRSGLLPSRDPGRRNPEPAPVESPRGGGADIPERETFLAAKVVRRDLGTLGGAESRATGINDYGLVVGESRTAEGIYHPFLWTDEAGMVDIGAKLSVHARSLAVNESGRILIETFNSIVFKGLIWQEDTGLTDLGALDSTFPFTRPSAMNEQGVVVGGSLDSIGRLRAFAWTPESGMFDLGAPGWGEATDVNDHGEVVGYSDDRAFLWTPERGVESVGPADAALSVATALNNRGEVVGFAEYEDGISRAFLWVRGAGTIDLGTLGSDFPLSLALGINDRGVVVGHSLSMAKDGSPPVVRAFRWTALGGMEDLGDAVQELTDSKVPGNQLAINALGQVVGAYAQSQGENDPLPLLWTEAGRVQLSVDDDPAEVSREALGVNNHNQIVGSSLKVDNRRVASLWEVVVSQR